MAFDLDGARKAGYSDDEIADFMSKELGFDAPAARDAGYSSKAIVGHLAETLKTRERAKVNAELDVPYRPVSRAVAPKQNAGGGRGMMAEQAGDRAAYESGNQAAQYPEPTAVRAAAKPAPSAIQTTGEITPINARTRGFGEILDTGMDLAKTGAAAAISGVASMPRGMVDAFRGMVRDSASKGLMPGGVIGNLASQAMGLNPTAAEARSIDRTMAGLEGPVGPVIDKGTLALNDAGKTASNRLRATRTIQGQANEAGFTPTGNLVEAVRNWDFSKLSTGDDKSVEGAAFQIVGVMGSLAPILLARVFPGGAAGTGFAMAAGEGSDTARTYIKKLSDDQLANGSPYFKALIEQGETPADARKMVTAKAEEQAAIIQGVVGGASGKFIESALTGKVQQIIQGFGSRSARMGGGAAIVGAQGGVEEFSEGLGAEYGINRAGVRKGYGEDSFANLVLGAIGEGPLGAAAGFNKGGPPEAPPADPYAPQSLFSTPPAAPPGGSSTTPAPDRGSGNIAGPSTQVAPQVIQSPEAAAAGLAPIVIPGTPDQNGAVGALTSSAPMLAAIDKATTEIGSGTPAQPPVADTLPPVGGQVGVAPGQAPAQPDQSATLHFDPPPPVVTTLPDSFPSKSAASIFIKQNKLQDVIAEKGDAGWMVRPAPRAETPEEATQNEARVQSLNATFERLGSAERVRAVRGDASEKSTVARVLGEVFGLPQVLVRGIKDNALYLDGVSYINAKLSQTGQVIQAAVHEAFHWAAATHPDIAQGYLDAITPFRRAGVLAERAKFENENLKPGERQFPLSAGRGEDFSKVNSAEEEVGADIWGALGMDPVLWQQMRAKDPGLFRAIRYRFLENVTRAINALSKRGVNVGKLVTDLDRVRELTSDAMAAVARRGDAKKPYLETFPDSTAKPTDIGKPISATAIPNSAPAAPPSATPAPAPKVKPKKRAKDAFLAFLGDHGVSMAHQKTITGETGKKGNRMIQFAGPMFRKNGRALDELALLAVEAGFLTQADIDAGTDNGGVNKLTEMIRRAHAGEAVKTVSQLEREFEQSMVEFDEYDTADLDLTPSDYEDAMDGATELQQARIEALTGRLVELLGEGRAEQEIDRIVRVTEGMSQEEYADELERTVEATARIQGADAGRGDQGGQGSQETDQGAPQEFSLEGPTQEGLKSKAAQAESRRQEQARRDAAPPADDFTPTGSDRQADRAAAAGQMELGAEEADPRNAKDAGYAPRRSKAKDEDGQIRAAIARVPGFDGPQTDALAKWIGARPDSARIVANLHQHAGTPWAKQSLQGALTRAAIEEYTAGRKPAFDSFLSAPSAKGLHALLESQGAAGAWAYLEREGLVGGSSKPVNSVSSSFIDCNPSSDCAKFCYAARGNFAFGNSVRKSELVTWAVEQDPVRVGRMMAGEYSATLEFQHQKALRLFDKGDGTTPWVKVIETLNAHVGPDGKPAPIRVQVFSKNPAFLRQVPAMNLRMLSADKSNMEVVRANPDLPVAFVYSDGSQVAFLNEIKDRVQVILPVKQGVKLLDQQKINALPKWTKPVVCPIDDGRVKIGKNQFQRTDDGSKLITQPGEWNCTRCDKAGGVGCFHGSTTDKAIAAFSSPVHTRDEDEVRKITDELRTLSGRLAPREREELLGSLGRLVSAIRAGIDIGTEGTGRAGDAARTGADDGWKPIRVSRPGDLEEGGGVKPPRRAKRGKDQLSFDYELDPSQAGPAGEAAKRRAVDAVDSLRGTAGILALALSSDLAARQRTTLVGQTVAAPVDLAVLAQVYRDPRFETFRIFFVDGQDRVVSQIGLTQRMPGAVNAVMGDDAYEFANNLMDAARKKGATGFYMLHNHPSGQATPSGADESMTVAYAQQLMPTMKFHGHIVIDTNEFSVIDRNGRSQKHIRDFKQKEPLDRGDWEYWQIKGPNDAMNIAKAIEKDPNAVTLIMTNYQLQVHAVTTIPRAAVSSNKEATFKAVARATLRNTGSHVFAVSHDLDALLRLRGLVQDGIHISPNGMVSSLRETRPYGGNTPHHKASLRASRLSPDTSEEFNYLRPVIKSAAPTSRNVPKGATGTLFEPPRRSKVDDLGFFSQLERAVEGAPIKAAPAEQWKAWLAGNAAKMGVKAEEIQWSGVTDWLALQTGKVTKDAVVQYLAGNGVQVTETVRGVGSNEASWQLADKMEELGYRVEDDGGDDVFYFDPQGNSIGYEELPPELQRAVDQWGRDASPPTKYQSYTLPGGQNYRELLLTLDQKREKKPLETISIDEALARVRNGLPVAFEDDMSTATIDRTISLTDPNSYYLEQVNGGFGRLLAARVDIDGSLIGPDDGPSASRFESGHWNEPNVLAHIRYNERTDADGKRVLFIEEIQSDWAQAGRKSGFRSARPDTTGWTAEKQYDGTNGYSVWRVFKADGSTASNGVNAESAGQAIEAIADRWAGSGVPNAPFVRDTKAWVTLAVKRMIIEAARRGFDRVAFTTGEQNAERYDLSKQVGRVTYTPSMNGGTLLATDQSDRNFIVTETGVSPDKLADFIGKDAAQKLIDQPLKDGSHELRGNGLKVGGDGMKSFYNQIVPGVVRDVLKKVGGGSMKVVTLPAIPGSKGNGWGSTDENMIGDPERSQPGFDITPAMREKVAGGLPRFSKTGSKAPLERDELGRFRFAYGRRLEDTVKALLDPILTRLALKMASPELRKKLRAMKAEIARAQETAVEVAESMKAMPTDQAEMISDIIEQELVAGTVPPAELVTIATRIGAAMEAQTNELVRLGMISQEAADRWRGRYLPRFYESKLSKRVDPWMQAVMMAIRRPKSMQGIKGNNLKARGLPLETIDVADLPSWLADGWEIRDENYRAGTSDRVTVWRDYTREEREEMGEIRDARFRFVMGYMAAQKDIALGRLFEKIAADTADTGPHPGWVKVPSTKVEETGVNRFGKLSGMWVPKEVFDHLAKYDDTGANHELLLMYRKALGLWKESKTVLNPTAHANNVFGNVTMAHFAGVSYWDVHKYAGTVRDLVKDAPMVREARDAGLFLSTMGKDEIVQALPESLRLLADMQESSLEKGGRRVWNALALWLRKPMGAAYAGEDLFFRYMIYRDARSRGLEPGDAVNYAADFVFEYDDLPKGAMAIRDTFLPFFSWTYKAIPAMFTTATNYPWRFAAPAVAMYAVNAAMYAVAFGEKDDDWWQKIGRYVTDSDFRDKVRAEEKSERANLPPWLKGNSFTLGLPKAIRLGMDELTGLPVFMDISRMFPAGDLLDANSNTGGVPWLQSMTPSNPVLTTITAMFANRDMWTGRDLVDKNDTSKEAATKRAEWAWKQFTPAIAFGNYQLDRVLDTVARAAGTEIPGMFRDHTGVGRDKLPVQPLYTIENTFGIKARPYDLEQSRQIGESQKRELIRSLEYEIKRTQRYVNAGVMSFSQASKQIETDKAKIQNLKQGLTLEGNEKD